MNLPILILNPLSDAEFVARVGEAMNVPGTPADLQNALRAYYPRAVVRSRGLDGEPTTWYVYRDGRWTSSVKEGEDARND